MTTPIDFLRGMDLITLVATVKDRESLQVIQRMTTAQRTVLEAQLAQLKQLEDAIGTRLKGMK